LDWVKELDFEHCELLDKTFLSKEYQERASDVIYKVQLRGKTAYIVILIEFQSSVDRFMALRILHYITHFYMRLKESEKQLEKLPPIFPIMIYNGLAAWTAPSNIAELIDNHELLGEFALNFNYFKIAENEISVERLLELGNIVSTLFLGEVHFDSALLVEALSKLRKHEERQLVSMLFNFFEQLLNHGKLSKVGQDALNKIHTDEEMNMLLESMKIYQEKIYQQGKLEGISEGKLEGISEGERKGKLETARAMLNEGISILFIGKVTGLSLADIEQLRH